MTNANEGGGESICPEDGNLSSPAGSPKEFRTSAVLGFALKYGGWLITWDAASAVNQMAFL